VQSALSGKKEVGVFASSCGQLHSVNNGASDGKVEVLHSAAHIALLISRDRQGEGASSESEEDGDG
jgi:hypothetical protein